MKCKEQSGGDSLRNRSSRGGFALGAQFWEPPELVKMVKSKIEAMRGL